MHRLTLFCFLVGIGTTCPAAHAWQPSSASSTQAENREASAHALPGVQFNKDVRPILSDKCYICHGPDAKAKHIPFRLDHEEDAKAKLPDGKHAIVEGHPEQSELIRRITAEKPAQRMPPAYTGV